MTRTEGNRMIRRTLFGMALVLGLSTTAVPAHAINYGQVDNGAHPYVALIALFDEDGEYAGRCSGTLIDEDVVLSAAHCTDGVAYAHIFFTEDLRTVDVATSTDYDAVGLPHAMPGWDGSLTTPDTHDLSVFTLDRSITDIEPAQLAEVGFLDELATRRGVEVEVVVTGDLAELHATTGPERRDAPRRTGVVEVDGHVLEVRLPVGPGEDAHDVHARPYPCPFDGSVV